MAQNKTRPTKVSVADFLKKKATGQQLADSQQLSRLFREVTGQPPKMWGPSIVGFGSYHYKYATGREGDIPMAGFSPRSGSTTVYVMSAMPGFRELVARLGKCKASVACLYINKLADVDQKVLRELIAGSYRHLKTQGLHGDVTKRSSKPRARAATGARTRQRTRQSVA